MPSLIKNSIILSLSKCTLMEALYTKTELHHFIESASDQTLQNFLISLASRPGEDPELRIDLERIVETNADIRIKLSALMVEYN